MRAIDIGNRQIGPGHPVFVIAEAGCNHENDFARAQEMVAAAARAGADAIKLQSFSPETLVTRDAPKFWDIPGPGRTQYDEFAEIQPRFTREQYLTLQALAKEQGIALFSTPCDEAWTDFLDGLGVPLFKIASMDVTHLPLLRHVAGKGKPIILSTGASSLSEVQDAVEAIRAEGNHDIVLLHCISNYPTAREDVNLRMMQHLAQAFPECVIGYSDHTIPGAGLDATMLAVAAGAKVLEKHFTFDRSRPGYDHEISADYDGLRRCVAQFREVERVLGRSVKAPIESEASARQLGRRSVVASVAIPKGARITPEMLAVKRPGTGIAPKELPQVVGRIARREVRADQVLTWECLER